MIETKNHEVESGQPRLEALANSLRFPQDSEEIHQTINAYARGDQAEQGLIASTFHDDVSDDHRNFQQRKEGGKTYTRRRAGPYHGHFETEGRRWQVLNRRVVDDWSRLDEIVIMARKVGRENPQRTRDTNDPSYHVLNRG